MNEEYSTNQQDTEVVEAEVTENNTVGETKESNETKKKIAAIIGGIAAALVGIIIYKKKVSPALKKLKAKKAKKKADMEAENEDNSEEESEG